MRNNVLPECVSALFVSHTKTAKDGCLISRTLFAIYPFSLIISTYYVSSERKTETIDPTKG